MTINIDIKRTGFPVKIGALEFWFDASVESLRRFFEVEEIAKAKVKEAEEKAKHIHFPEVIDSMDDLEIETVNAAIDFNKEFIAAQYDVLLGDGAFKKIYKQYSDIWALKDALEVLGLAIAEKIEEIERERIQVVESKKDAYLKKKAQKR